MEGEGVKTQMNRGCRRGFAVLTRGDLLEDPVGAKVEEAVGVEPGSVHGHSVLRGGRMQTKVSRVDRRLLQEAVAKLKFNQNAAHRFRNPK